MSENIETIRLALDFVNRQPCRCMSIAQLGERDYCDRCNAIRAIKQADAAIALMRGQSWQPIETAPKDGSPILIFHPEGGVCEGFCPGEGFGWHVMDGTNTYIGQKSGKSLPSLTTYMTPPTHWQPLPSPPKDSADEQ